MAPASLPGVQPKIVGWTGALRGFRDGFLAPWEGFLLLRRHRSLWPYAFLPVAFNLFLTFALVGAFVAAWIPFAGTGTGSILAAVVLGVLATVSVAAIWFLLQAAVCGFVYARLARAVERQLGARPEDLRELPVMREILDGVRSFCRLVLSKGLVLLLVFLPFVGPALVFVVGGIVDSWFFGREFLQIPLAVRGQDREALKRFTARHRAATHGLGTATLLFSLVPLLNSVLLTTSVVGAVLLRRRLSGEPLSAPPVLAPNPVPPAAPAILDAGTGAGR